MRGEKWETVKEAILDLIEDDMEECDRMCIVTFDTHA